MHLASTPSNACRPNRSRPAASPESPSSLREGFQLEFSSPPRARSLFPGRNLCRSSVKVEVWVKVEVEVVGGGGGGGGGGVKVEVEVEG